MHAHTMHTTSNENHCNHRDRRPFVSTGYERRDHCGLCGTKRSRGNLNGRLTPLRGKSLTTVTGSRSWKIEGQQEKIENQQEDIDAQEHTIMPLQTDVQHLQRTCSGTCPFLSLDLCVTYRSFMTTGLYCPGLIQA